jgi:hypothetical protein
MRVLIAFPLQLLTEVNLAVVCYLPFSLARSLTSSEGLTPHLPNPPDFKTHPAYTSQPTSCRACLISVTHTPAAGNPGLPAHRRASCVCESLTWNGSSNAPETWAASGVPTPRVSKRGKLHYTVLGWEKITCQAALGATAAAARQHRNPRCVGHSPACLVKPCPLQGSNGCEGKGRMAFLRHRSHPMTEKVRGKG